MIGKCQHYTQHKSQQPTETQLKHEIPVTPWSKVATNISLEQHVIYNNNWLYNKILQCTIAEKLWIDHSNKKRKHTFATFGVPQIVISDNGSDYKSEKFQQFAKDWDFKHITTNPNYPQANWLAVRNIQTIKKIPTKVYESKQDLYLAIIAKNYTFKRWITITCTADDEESNMNKSP